MTNEHHDDSFLHQLPEPPRPEFARNLAARLQRVEPEPVHGRRWPALPRLDGRRAALGIAAAGAVVLAVLGVTMPFSGDSHSVSAAEVLERAQAAASAAHGPRTYHARATTTDHRSGTVVTTQETWYGGSGRARIEFQSRKGSGAPTLSGLITNGARLWQYTTENGQTRYEVHNIDADAKSIDAKFTGGNVSSLADVLARYNPVGSDCAAARHQGETAVAGRAAYLIAVTFSADCPAKPGQPQIARQTVAVDKQTFLPLRTQIHSADGALLHSYEVQSIEYDVVIPDSTFTYTPPPGAVQVPVPSKAANTNETPSPSRKRDATPSPSATRTR